MKGMLDPTVSQSLWQALEVRGQIAWRIARHGLSPEVVMKLQDEDILALHLVGPVSLREIRDAVSRIKFREEPVQPKTWLVPVCMNRCRGNHNEVNSRSELLDAGFKILGREGCGRTACYRVVPPSGWMFEKDYPLSLYNKWWTIYDANGIARMQVYRDDAVGFEDRFLNVLEVPKVIGQHRTAA